MTKKKTGKKKKKSTSIKTSESPLRGRIRPSTAGNITKPSNSPERDEIGHAKALERIRQKKLDNTIKLNLLEDLIKKQDIEMKDKLFDCVEEANNFSKTLNNNTFFRIILKPDFKNTKESHKNPNFDLMVISRKDQLQWIKYSNLVVQLGQYNPYKVIRLLSPDKFYLEHELLHVAIINRRSLMPVNEAAFERLHESIKTEDFLKTINSPKKAKSQDPQDPYTDAEFASKWKPNVTQSEPKKMTKKEANERLRKILLDLVEKTSILTHQANVIKSKGWNVGV